MSRFFLLDTIVLSEPLRDRPDAGVMAMLERHDRHLCTASVVWHELHYGLERLPPSARRTRIARYLQALHEAKLPVISYDDRAARWHARQRAALASSGRTPPFADGQIAAIAAVNGLVLVSRNLPDFQDFEGVELESWFTR